MGESFLTVSRIAWLVGVALLVMVANVVASILYMVVYSYVIDPGHQKEYYEAHVKIAAPYCSIVAGIPLMFAVGWWLGVPAAMVVWLVYALVDGGISVASGLTLKMGVIVAISILTKLVAGYLGGLAGRQA